MTTRPLTSRILAHVCGCTAILLAAGSCLAWDGTPITYVTIQLGQHPATLLDLRDRSMRIRDANNRERTLPFDQLAAIYFEHANASGDAPLDPSPITPTTLIPGATPAAQGLLITTDNQRLRGRPVEGDPGPEALLWDGPPFGPRIFPLESLRALRPGAGGAIILPERLDNDIITFKNGDRAPTFIESILATRPAPEPSLETPQGMTPREAAAWQRARRATRSAAAQRRTASIVTGVVRADVQNVPTDIPLDRIQSITFANPPQRPGPLPRAWLNDATVIASTSLALDVPRTSTSASLRRLGDAAINLEAPSERASLILTTPTAGPGSQRVDQSTLPGPEANGKVPLDRVQAIALDASRLMPLSACTLRSEPLPGTDRRWTPPARINSRSKDAWAPLDSFDITLPGPMVLTIDLPATATHIGGSVTLPLSARPLASCTVSVALLDASGTTHELATGSLSAKSPSFPVSAPMPDGAAGPFRMRVTLDPGGDGPIQDSAVLRRFLVLLAP